MGKGLVHIYCGEGKGKTTASIGLATRAAGDGKKVIVTQFLKGRPSGEVASLSALPGVEVLRSPEIKKFAWEMDDQEKAEARKQYCDLLEAAIARALAGGCDLLILDESLGACSCAFLDEADLLRFISEKPEALEVVLTGRGPSQALIDAADYVTEMKKVKHPFDKGIPARKGIEF